MITRLFIAPCFLQWSGKVIAEFEMPLSWYDYPIHLQSLSFSHPYSQFVFERHQINLVKPYKNIYPKCVCFNKEVTLRNDVLYGILRKDESLLIQNNSLFTLFVYFSYRTMMTVFIFGVRGFISGAFQGFYVYTPEVHVIDWTKNDTKENM